MIGHVSGLAQFHVPMPDWQQWRRVTFFGMPTFAGFRYGDEHHAVMGIWVRENAGGAKLSPAECLDRFESWADLTQSNKLPYGRPSAGNC